MNKYFYHTIYNNRYYVKIDDTFYIAKYDIQMYWKVREPECTRFYILPEDQIAYILFQDWLEAHLVEPFSYIPFHAELYPKHEPGNRV